LIFLSGAVMLASKHLDRKAHHGIAKEDAALLMRISHR
jgi:hypothetical protein